MKKKYVHEVTLPAEQDMQSVFDYIAFTLLNPDAAINLAINFDTSFEDATKFPHRFPTCEHNPEYRKIFVGSYVALFRIDEDAAKIYITRVFYGGMEYARYL